MTLSHSTANKNNLYLLTSEAENKEQALVEPRNRASDEEQAMWGGAALEIRAKGERSKKEH